MQPATRFLSKLLTVVVGAQASLGLLIGAAPLAHAATPIAPVQPASHLVISEIQTSPNQGFIELYNPTAQAVDLNGWSVQYLQFGAEYPVSNVNTVLLDATDSIPAHGHFLIRGEPTAPADAYSSLALGHGSGTVLLVAGSQPVASADDSTVVDKVGYGRLAEDAEGAPAPVPSSGSSIERLPGRGEGNGTDTNNNSADFFVAISSPQTSSSATEQPTGPVISNFRPANGDFLNTTTPVISAIVTDAGSGIDPEGFDLVVAGEHVTPTYNPGTGELSLQVLLPAGTFTAQLTATDKAGIQTQVMSSFTIDTTAPTLNLQVPTSTSSYTVSAQLNGADDRSGLSAMRVSFDGVLDTEPWESYMPTVTRDLVAGVANQQVIAQVSDRAGNQSVVMQAPITVNPVALTAPVSAISSTVGDTITITWPAVPGVTHYLVKYTDGTTIYGPLLTTDTAIVISKLDPNKKYRFEVGAVDRSGAVSSFTKVFPPAPATGTLATVEKPPVVTESSSTTDQQASNDIAANNESNNQTVKPTPTPSATPSISPSPSPSPEVKGGDDSRSPDWTRIIVALSILIIAAGVATGGWYLYQWLASRPNDDNKGGRW